jgi:hypothetical protein
MIETVGTFVSRNLRKQAGRVLITTHPYLSGLIAGYLVFYSGLELKPFSLASAFLPYDTVVFGFTATAIALAIAIPSERFVTFLSGIKDGSTPFRDFLFILAWNGLVHIIAFFLFLPFVFLPQEWSVFSSRELDWSKVYVFVLLWLQVYACFQFLVTTLGVYELADLYANYCARQRQGTEREK